MHHMKYAFGAMVARDDEGYSFGTQHIPNPGGVLMSSTRIFSAAFAAVLLASPLVAQNGPSASLTGIATSAPMLSAPIAPVSTPTAVSSPVAAPSLASAQAAAPVGVHVIALAPPMTPAPTPRSTGNSPAMMIVGGVMLLTGAVIGGESGTIVMLGGAALGLIGLWQYLR
jgi:hypothetical protein